MAKIIWKGGALLAPIPAVLVTCRGIDRNGVEAENIFTVAWTGILNTVPPKTYISVRKSRYSYDIIKNSGEFVINVPASRMVREVDYCGIYTGAKVDKFDKCGFTLEAASEVAAPCIGECPLSLECRVTDIVEMGTHDMFVADIICTDVNEDIIDAEGKLRLDKAQLMAFAHGEYFALGKKIGSFGFSAKKKSKSKNAVKVRENKDEINEKAEKGFKQSRDSENKSTKKRSDKKDEAKFAFAVKEKEESITSMNDLLEFVENGVSDDDAFPENTAFDFEDKTVKKYKGSPEKKGTDGKSYGSKDRKRFVDKERAKSSENGGRYSKDGYKGKENDCGKHSRGTGRKEYVSFEKGGFQNEEKATVKHGKSDGKKGYTDRGTDKKHGYKRGKRD